MSKPKATQNCFFSMVTDGMAQNHCILPWQKNLATAVKPTLAQHIQGVIIHGRKTIFYRTFHTVANTSSLQIHTFLLSLEKIRMETGVLPDTLYYQVDGGSENTAKAVYFLCELIVARRLVKCIKLCRLMVGHTHCDIDTAFAKVWTHNRVRHIILSSFVNPSSFIGSTYQHPSRLLSIDYWIIQN